MTNPPLPSKTETVRVTVPVTLEVLAKFQRFSDVSGLSVGKSMGDWLRDTVQGLDAMVEIMEMNRSRPAEALNMLGRYASTLQDMTDGAIASIKEPQPQREGAPLAGKSLDAAKAAINRASKHKFSLTAPSSNTGGKVPRVNPRSTGPKV